MSQTTQEDEELRTAIRDFANDTANILVDYNGLNTEEFFEAEIRFAGIIKAHSEKVALEAGIKEQEFMAQAFGDKFLRTDFNHEKLLDFTRDMSQRLEGMKARLNNQDKRPDVPYELVEKLATHVSNTRTENVQLDISDEGASDTDVTRSMQSANNAHYTIEKVLNMVYWYGFLEGRDEMVAPTDEAMSEGDALATIKQIVSNEIIGSPISCKPGCTDVEHAYHQGSWDTVLRQEEALEKVMGAPQ